MLISPHGRIVRLSLRQNPTKHSDTCAVHPELHFVTHIPQTGAGEQLVAQLFRCIPERSWLFRYGRIPMSFLLADWVWRVGSLFFILACSGRRLTLFQRISSPPNGAERCKMSVIAEASSHSSLSLPPEQLLPYLDHFHPASNVRITPRSDNKRRGSPFVGLNIVPHDQQVCLAYE
jgi:transcription factor 1